MNIKFGKAMSALRRKDDIEQKDMAIKLGISTNYLSLLENDKKTPSPALLASISEYFDIPVSVLFFKALEYSNYKLEGNTKETFEAAKPLIDMFLGYLNPNKEDSKMKEEAIS